MFPTHDVSSDLAINKVGSILAVKDHLLVNTNGTFFFLEKRIKFTKEMDVMIDNCSIAEFNISISTPGVSIAKFFIGNKLIKTLANKSVS